jgi:glycosyltransferase involved in cell wall biosynthesis
MEGRCKEKGTMRSVLMLLSNAFLPDPRPLAEAKALLAAGYKVRILCWDRGEDLPGRELIDGIEVERIRIRSTHGRGTLQVLFLAVLWLKLFFRSFHGKFDVVYAHDLDTVVPAMLIRLCTGKKLVFDSHEVFSRMLGDNIIQPIKLFAGWLEKIAVRSADSVIVTCDAMKRLYRSYGAENVRIVGNWKDPRDYEPEEKVLTSEKERLGIKDELVVLCIANLGRERVIEPLLNIARNDPGIFVIVGGDGEQSGIVSEAAGSSPNIIYLGYVPPARVPLYTVLSDVIYYGYDINSGMAEFNSPNKLFEALAAGRAFLGGDFGEMGKITREEKCGLALRDFSELSVKKALDVLKDRGELSRFKDNAKKAAVEKYNWDFAGGVLLEIITGLYDGK